MPIPNIIPQNEGDRLAAVRRYDILDTPPDDAFDRVTRLAAGLFDVPIAIISFVDHDRIWFKSRYGVDVSQIGRDPGLCASAILGDDVWIVTDAISDARAFTNPLVTGEFGLRFYVAAPLRTHDGFNLGTLGVGDRAPRRAVTPDQIDQLADLAALVIHLMELRLSAKRALDRVHLVKRELDHRVITTLQSLSLMLAMQADTATDADAHHQLRGAASRMNAIADIHRAFFTAGSADRISPLAYLRQLCSDLGTLLGAAIDVDGSEMILQPIQIQSIGLIVHELVSNAVGHGGRSVQVALGPDGDGRYAVTVSDDGPGLPPGFEANSSTAGIGMSVVMAMVEQLAGKLSTGPADGGKGARFTISFPAMTLMG